MTNGFLKQEIRSTAMIGGSFDPVHLGHLHLIHCIVSSTDYDRIILVPVAVNNFKQQDSHPASPQDRLAMLKLAVEGYSSMYPDDRKLELTIDSCELERGGVSYTFDTVKEIYEKYQVQGKLAVVMGDDLLEGLRRWHRFEELKDMVTFVVCRRADQGSNVFDHGELDMRFIDNAVFEDSSTQIRNACARLDKQDPLPKDITALMPRGVAEYVQLHGLYRA